MLKEKLAIGSWQLLTLFQMTRYSKLKPQGSEISYFYFSRPGTDTSESDNILFTLQLIID
jgi:hypothetical protein